MSDATSRRRGALASSIALLCCACLLVASNVGFPRVMADDDGRVDDEGPADVTPRPAPDTKAIDVARAAAVLDGLVRPDEPGLAAMVRWRGRTVLSRGYGRRDLRSRRTVDARTDFRLASVTKQFTAMAIMLLVRDGRLRYQDTLTDLLPAFPAYGRAITIRHLLTHTAGLPDYEELMEASGRDTSPAWTVERQIRDHEVLSLLRGETRGRFAPGTSWAYSNSGYVVLGLIVARVSGQPFGDFLRKRIFRPLRMDHTVAYQAGRHQVPNRAFGHVKTADGFREADQSPTSATLGDGGVYSNLEDLARWDDALRASTLLSPAAMRPALTPVRLADGAEPHWPAGAAGGDNLEPGRPVAYGFGWFLDPWRGQPRQWHHGETMGFRSILTRLPETDLTVVLLANRDDFDLRALANRLLDVRAETSAPATKDLPRPPD